MVQRFEFAPTPSSVTVLEMETFFGPWAEISVLKEDVMGPEHEQSQRFKVSGVIILGQLFCGEYKHLKLFRWTR